jgi:hypothetical protein
VQAITNKTELILGLTLAAILAVDSVTTMYALKNGIGIEGNPFVVNIIMNPVLNILVKCIELIVIILMVNGLTNYSKTKMLGYLGLSLCICISTLVVIHTSIVIQSSGMVL